MRVALNTLEHNYGTEHPHLVTAISNLAEVLAVQGKAGDAEALLKRGLEINQKAFGPDHPTVATSYEALGTAYVDRKDYAQAEASYKTALAIVENYYGTNSSQALDLVKSLINLYGKMGKKKEVATLQTRLDTDFSSQSQR